MVVAIRIKREFGSGESVGHVWAVSGDDRSPVHLIYLSGYVARCDYCWLGHLHTQKLHTQELRDREIKECYRDKIV